MYIFILYTRYTDILYHVCCIQHGSALLGNSFPSLAMIQQMIRHESSLIISSWFHPFFISPNGMKLN